MKKQRSPLKLDTKISLFADIIRKLQTKRKRYSVQVLKQFILFPDQSESSQKTVSKFDSLIFSDQLIHTMFKKIQTKLIQSKIWAFLNLKYHRYLKAAKKMQQPIKAFQRRIEHKSKHQGFISIKSYSQIRLKNQKVLVTTQTQVQNSCITSPKKQSVVSPRKPQGSATRIQINLDIRHQLKIGNSQQTFPRFIQPPREKLTYQNLPVHSQPHLAYPLSQLHPLHSKETPKTAQPTQTQIVRQPRLVKAESAVQNRQRSRSGSIIRYQYDLNGSKRIIVNGKQVPMHVKLKRSQSPMEEPEYRVSRERVRLQQQKYQFGGISRMQQQKRENLKYEYQNKGEPLQSKLKSPRNHNQNRNENQTKFCQQCGQQHSTNLICSQRKSHKVVRIRSKSKKGLIGSYLQHLN